MGSWAGSDQHFLLFLVAHFHKAALHMFSDRLIAAVSRLDIGDTEANRVFRRDIRSALENFLRFEHRYWFHEISNQAQARELFQLARQHLDLDVLYREIREELPGSLPIPRRIRSARVSPPQSSMAKNAM